MPRQSGDIVSNLPRQSGNNISKLPKQSGNNILRLLRQFEDDMQRNLESLISPAYLGNLEMIPPDSLGSLEIFPDCPGSLQIVWIPRLPRNTNEPAIQKGCHFWINRVVRNILFCDACRKQHDYLKFVMELQQF